MKKISLLIMTGLAGIITAFADVTISPTSRDWAANGGGATVSTLGSGSWTATTDVSWITLVKSTGTAGDACSYLVAKNPDADARVGHITIAGMVFTVTQQGCSVELSPASATFSCTGGLGKFTAIMDVAVTWTASPSDSWIKMSPSFGVGPTEISYTVAAFDEVGSRTGTIRIGSDSFTINQTGVDVTLSPTVTNITKDVCIVPVQVVAMTGVRWTVTPNVSWISVLDGGSGFGGSQITLVAAENPSVAKRTGTVSVGSATLTVIQEGTDDVSFRILPEVAEASPNGAFGNVAVYATPDATWSAESLDDWIRITAGAEGSGNGNVKYVTLSNPEQTNRTGHIKFTPPAVTPDFDLYAGLLFWIKEQTNIEGNEERRTTYPLSKVFDGSFANPLGGAAIPAKDEDDYTLSLSFKVGEIDCVNRLFKVGGHTVYLDEDNILYYHTVKTDFTVESAERYYSLVFRMTRDRQLTIYAGEKDSELHAVWSGPITGQLTFVNPLAMSTFNLGYGEMPSAGYLQSGQFANIRFWTRALTDRECECADTRQNEMLEMKPAGISGDVKYDFFPLSGNMFGADETASGPILPSKNHISGSGWKTTSSRTRVRECALTSEGNGLVEIHQFGEIVDKTKVVTNANSIVRSVWGNGRLIYIGNTFTADDSKDATYMMWMNLNTMPADEVALLSRKMSSLPIYEKLKARPGLSSVCQDLDSPEWAEYFAGKLLNNFNLEVFLEKDGALRVKQSSARVSNNGWVDLYPGWMSSHYYAKYKLVENETTNIDITNTGISPDKWMMIALVCKAERSITIFIDGTEVGSLPTSMTFGWLPPFDISTNEQQDQYGDHIYRYETQHEYVFSVGGWNGAFDELTIYQKALSAKEVQAAYDAGLPAQDVYHTVKQGIQQLELSVDRIEIGKAGGASNVTLTVANGVKWTVVPNVDWLSVAGSPSGAGSANLNVQIAPNPTIVQRTGTMQIGAKTLTVVQEGLNCAVTVDQTLFDVESSMGVIEVSPEQNGSWTISTDVDWISLAVDSGIGSADVYFFVDYFDDPDMSRTGTITVGDKSIYITQRGYELSIEPMIANVGGNAGAGEIGVAADIDSIWTAIASVPWIRIEQGADGIGSGTVRYTFTENTTGQIRTGHIRISGEEYTVNQMYRVVMSVGVEGRGSVTGAGNYDYGDDVTLTATPEEDYQFSHWSGAATGSDNPVTIRIDEACKATAHFTPVVPVATAMTAEKDGVTISWGALAWAEQYLVYRAESGPKPETPVATVSKGTLTWKDTAATPGQNYSYWVEAVGTQEQVPSAAVTGKRAVSLTGVTISCVSELFASASANCTCTAAYNNGTSKSVAPSWSVDGAGATINASGVLTAAAVEADTVVTVRASYTEDGITKTASVQVTICPTVALDEVTTGVGAMTTGGNGAWFGQRREPCGGVPALRSPRLSSGASAWVGCSVTGAGTLTFKWRKEETDAGKLALTVNGGETAVCGEVSASWATVKKEFTDGGAKTFKWAYTGGANAEAHGLVAEICWTPGTAITVNFNANGGSGAMASMTFLQGSDKTLTANAFTRTGYAFAGWATSAGGAVVYANGASVKNLAAAQGAVVNLYAKWTANTYSVKFDANGGVGTMTDDSMTYDAAKALTANGFTRAGYVFAGWATSKNGEVVYADGAGVVNLVSMGAVTLYARWTSMGCSGVGMQLWEGGPYWAECNVGATKPEEGGYYFWWGDTVGYKRNSNNDGWISVKDGTSFSFNSGNSPTFGKNNSQLQSEGYIDATGNLVAAHDAATAHLGAPWRMPTDAEFSALIHNCDTEWTSRNGISGRLVKGRGAYASKSIFLPAAGDGHGSLLNDLGSHGLYWSSTPDSDNSYSARHQGFYPGGFFWGYGDRNLGRSVRPVRDFEMALYYAVSFNANGGAGVMEPLMCEAGRVYKLPKCGFAKPEGKKRFVGWAGSNGRRYDDEMLVFNLAPIGGSVTLKAIWDPAGEEEELGGVQLWENGPYWAECNVGATKPEEAGYYFWWGDTVGYKRNPANNGWVSVKDGSSFLFSYGNCPTYGKKNSVLQSEGYIDATGNLVAAHDAATAHRGAPWRMPTDAEFAALINNCDTEWTSRNGVSGRLVKGRGTYASKSIFLPAVGYGYEDYLSYLGSYGFYWSSAPESDYSAWCLDFNSGGFFRGRYISCRGKSVRPVRGFAK